MNLTKELKEKLPESMDLVEHDFSNIFELNKEKIVEEFENNNYSNVVTRTLFPSYGPMANLGYGDPELYKSIYNFKTKYGATTDSWSNVLIDLDAFQYEKDKVKSEDMDLSLREIAEKCDRECGAVRDIIAEIKNINLEKLEKEDLLEILRFCADLILYIGAYLMVPLSAEEYLETQTEDYLKEKLEDPEKAEEYYAKLMTPLKENRHTKEQINLLKMAKEYYKEESFTEEIEEMIEDHIFRFGSLGVKYGKGEVWTKEEVKKRIKDTSKEESKKRYKELSSKSKNQTKEVREILDKIDADDQFRDHVEVTRYYIYIRTLRTDVISDLFTNMIPMFELIGEWEGFTKEEVLMCFPHELVEANLPSKDRLNKRKRGWLTLAKNGKVYIVEGDDAKEIKDRFDMIEENETQEFDESVKKLDGNATYEGVVEGVVKVIADNSELDKVEEGDILVTSMTTPDFVPAMERAAAFVTDEGGILCHAAIVSREMEKPCIVGTENASSVLKDGDRVKVNAEEGIIKILN